MKVLILLLLMSGCNYITTNEHEMGRYPEIEYFIKTEDRVQTKHFFDSGLIEFHFWTNLEDYFFYTDSIALSHKWENIKKTENERTYIKNIKSYPSDESIDSLTINFENKDGRIKIVWK